ncbi:MAG: phosphatidate cytidylyltransferase, partial [Porphyromonadaceae bacterium]|nr:phosphatidate cytidylyltransferase [Porphyromonadaceae bacterium]
MSNLVKRAVFGSLYVGLILAALLLREDLVYMIVFGLLAFLGTWEWSNLVSTHRLFPLRRIFDATAAVYLFWATHEIADKGIAYAVLVPYAGYLLYILVRSIYSERQAMPTDLAKVIFGQIYVGGFLSIANIFYTDTDTSSILLTIFVSIWANDTGAYLAGSTLGRHKLFPSVSPKKSWEGFVGGLIAAVVATGLLLGWEQCYIGVIISIAATWGDLFESMVKRSVGVKDSGNIIPG